MTIATDLGKVVTQMQLERSEVAFYIFTNGSKLRYFPFIKIILSFFPSFSLPDCCAILPTTFGGKSPI